MSATIEIAVEDLDDDSLLSLKDAIDEEWNQRQEKRRDQLNALMNQTSEEQ